MIIFDTHFNKNSSTGVIKEINSIRFNYKTITTTKICKRCGK